MTSSLQVLAHRRKRTVARKVGGYADVYDRYIHAGWTPLPLPRGAKKPPPAGYTGEGRTHPAPRCLERWAKTYPDGNVALVMPDGVVGIDIDAYNGGANTFRRLVKRYGSIPNAPFSTSRHNETGNYRSGIYMYRVPPGTVLVGALSGGIEIIQPHHRYAIAWPSIHPEGRTYRWHDADGTAGIPAVGDLPDLPEPWRKGLTKRTAKHDGSPFDGDVDDWISQLPDGALSLMHRARMSDAYRRLRYPGGRYDTMVSAVARLVSWGAAGLPVADEINNLYNAYVAAVDADRDGESEFFRALEGAIAKFGDN